MDCSELIFFMEAAFSNLFLNRKENGRPSNYCYDGGVQNGYIIVFAVVRRHWIIPIWYESDGFFP